MTKGHLDLCPCAADLGLDGDLSKVALVAVGRNAPGPLAVPMMLKWDSVDGIVLLASPRDDAKAG